MKTFSAAVALAAALAQPASAITFPSLTTIYVGAGIMDGSQTLFEVATAFSCSNVSGQVANLRVLILKDNGSVAADVRMQALVHGGTVTLATQAIPAIAAQSMGTGAVLNGTVNIESTESAIFCTAMILDTSNIGPNGVALHLVRVNPHPGTVD